MFVHCSHCVFLCILLGCLTHKLWLSNCVSMKRSYSVCFTPALRLRPLLSGGIWVTLQQGQSFQGMIFCFGTPTLFWRRQTSDFCLRSVSRDSAAGILWIVEQQGSFLRRESVQNKVFEYFPWQVFSVYLYIIFIFIAFEFPSPSEISWFRNLMSLWKSLDLGIWCLRGQLVMNLSGYLCFVIFFFVFSFFFISFYFLFFWCHGATVRSGCKNSVSSGYMAFCWSCSWWELVRNWVLMSSHMVTSGWSNSFKQV